MLETNIQETLFWLTQSGDIEAKGILRDYMCQNKILNEKKENTKYIQWKKNTYYQVHEY